MLIDTSAPSAGQESGFLESQRDGATFGFGRITEVLIPSPTQSGLSAARSHIFPMDQSQPPSLKRHLSGAANSGAQWPASATKAAACADRRIISRRENVERVFCMV